MNSGTRVYHRHPRGSATGGQFAANDSELSRSELRARKITRHRVRAYKLRRRLGKLENGTPQYKEVRQQYLESVSRYHTLRNANSAPKPEYDEIRGMNSSDLAREIQKSPVFRMLTDKKYTNIAKQYGRGKAVRQLVADIIHERGFDKKPNLVDEVSLENGGILAFRGIPEQTFRQQFKTGDLFVGQGIFGDGVYTSSMMSTASVYAGDVSYHGVMTMRIPKDAKGMPYYASGNGMDGGTIANKVKPPAAIKKEGAQYGLNHIFQKAKAQGWDKQHTVSEIKRLKAVRDSASDTPEIERAFSLAKNPSVLALVLGYDYVDTESDVYVIFNRGILDVER